MTFPRTVNLAANPPATVNVDAGASRHPIDPRIYGAAFADAATINALGITLNRWGGNRATRYNWSTNFGNTAADYFFENIDEAGAFGMGTADAFCDTARASNAQPVLTIPMIGWTAKDATHCSFSVAKYGAQDAADGDCGDGLVARVHVTNNTPGDASTPVDSAFEASWVQHLIDKYGLASAGGIRYYSLDNEPQLWNSSHFDIHPLPVDYNEAWTKISDYAPAIRAKDSAALITGPEEWEWTALFDSAKDWMDNTNADRTAHGNLDYIAWLLQQAKAYEVAHGVRILDVATVHYYPQSGENSTDVTPAMQALRNRSTRSLWDPAYVDESWMGSTTYPGTATKLNGGKPALIPSLKQWVQTYYPGTQVGVTEYNWGAESHINGGTAQADILGILGREGADVGVRWVAPAAGTFTYAAFKMFRNYDDAHSAFGDTSVSAGGTNPDETAVFAAQRSSDHALTIILINKLTGQTSATVNLSNFSPVGGASVQRWQLTSDMAQNPSLTQQPNLSVSSSAITLTLPAQSVTLLIVPGSSVAASPVNVGADYGGDGRGDVLLRDGNGNIGVWMMNGTSISRGASIGSPGGTYTVAGVGDFNGDSKGDILLRDGQGNIGMWLMNGSTIVSGALVGSPGGSYTVAGIGDFDGDGKSDILLRDAGGNLGVWLMNGPVIRSGALVGSPGGSYSVVGVGDFDGDGKADILLRDSTGNLGLWLMNGATIVSGAFVGSPGGSYTVAGVGDFTGDHKTDILLRDSLGNFGMWVMNGSAISSGAFVGSPGGSYTVTAINDYNGDGKADILLRDSTGTFGMWIMNGPAITSGAMVGSPGPSYTAY